MIADRLKFCIFLALAAMWAAGCGGEGQLFEKMVPGRSLRNNILGESIDQPIAVYLPPSYASSSKRYPAVYLLPGFNTDTTVFLDGTYRGLNIVESMDRLIEEGKIEEMIVVIVNGRNSLGGSFYVNSPVTGNWKDFVVRDVVRFVDREYKTRPYAAARGITGHSMGGFGALYIAMRHPDVFGAVYSMSPGLFDSDGIRTMGLFADEAEIDLFLRKQREFNGMSREGALAASLSYIEELYASGEERQQRRAFVYAYGAAFCCDPGLNAPHIVYPFVRQDGKITTDAAVLKVWEDGFGGIAGEVGDYEDSLLSLGGIAIDVGAEDAYRWILDGCRFLSETLKELGIPNELLIYDGGHDDQLRERIEGHMLPYFSRVLSGE